MPCIAGHYIIANQRSQGCEPFAFSRREHLRLLAICAILECRVVQIALCQPIPVDLVLFDLDCQFQTETGDRAISGHFRFAEFVLGGVNG